MKNLVISIIFIIAGSNLQGQDAKLDNYASNDCTNYKVIDSKSVPNLDRQKIIDFSEPFIGDVLLNDITKNEEILVDLSRVFSKQSLGIYKLHLTDRSLDFVVNSIIIDKNIMIRNNSTISIIQNSWAISTDLHLFISEPTDIWKRKQLWPGDIIIISYRSDF